MIGLKNDEVEKEFKININNKEDKVEEESEIKNGELKNLWQNGRRFSI